MKKRYIYPGGSDGAGFVPLGYNPKAETASESYEWWMSQVLLENTEAKLPKSRYISEAVAKMRERIAYIEKVWRGR